MAYPILTEKRILEVTENVNFEEVLNILSLPLIDGGYMTADYNQAILKNLSDNGPYFVLAPYIALPHSQETESVFHPGISVVRTTENVDVAGSPVRVFIMLASNNPEAHMDLLVKMVELMDTEEKQHELVHCSFDIFKQKFSTIID